MKILTIKLEYKEKTVFWKTFATIEEVEAFQVELNNFIKENKIWKLPTA